METKEFEDKTYRRLEADEYIETGDFFKPHNGPRLRLALYTTADREPVESLYVGQYWRLVPKEDPVEFEGKFWRNLKREEIVRAGDYFGLDGAPDRPVLPRLIGGKDYTDKARWRVTHRILDKGEIVQEGDDYKPTRSSEWVKTCSRGHKVGRQNAPRLRYRRPLPEKEIPRKIFYYEDRPFYHLEDGEDLQSGDELWFNRDSEWRRAMVLTYVGEQKNGKVAYRYRRPLPEHEDYRKEAKIPNFNLAGLMSSLPVFPPGFHALSMDTVFPALDTAKGDVLDALSYSLFNISRKENTMKKYRRLGTEERLKMGDEYFEPHLGKWKPTRTLDHRAGRSGFEYRRPLSDDLTEREGKTYRPLEPHEETGRGDRYTTTQMFTCSSSRTGLKADHDPELTYFREVVPSEPKAPPKGFLEYLGKECVTVDGYSPADLAAYLESVKKS